MLARIFVCPRQGLIGRGRIFRLRGGYVARALWSNITVSMGARGVHRDLQCLWSYDGSAHWSLSFCLSLSLLLSRVYIGLSLMWESAIFRIPFVLYAFCLFCTRARTRERITRCIYPRRNLRDYMSTERMLESFVSQLHHRARERHRAISNHGIVDVVAPERARPYPHRPLSSSSSLNSCWRRLVIL